MRTLRWFRSERGSQIVEFALIAPILIYLVLSIPVFAIFSRSWLVISAAARDGARAASLYSVTNRTLVAQTTAANSVNLDRGDGKYFRGESDVHVTLEGNMITVTVEYRQPTYLPLMGFLTSPGTRNSGDTATLRARAMFLVEGS